MRISTGDKIPDVQLLQKVGDEIGRVSLRSLTSGNKVVIFGLPGAFTGTCTSSHVPSFIRTAQGFREKGYAHIICFAVNDPHVMAAWAQSTGGDAAGLTFLADADASLTKALGLNFTAPAAGFYDRTTRHAMLVEDGVITVLRLEESRGVCDLTAGESLLEIA